MKLYQYPKCSTCRKAIKFINEQGLNVDVLDISQVQPSIEELEQMLLTQGDIKKLFNTSGLQYRELEMKNKLPNMSDSDALELLSSNGMLIKRPFLIGKQVAIVGFKEEVWLAGLNLAQ